MPDMGLLRSIIEVSEFHASQPGGTIRRGAKPILSNHLHIGTTQEVNINFRLAVLDVVRQVPGILPKCLRLDDPQLWDADCRLAVIQQDTVAVAQTVYPASRRSYTFSAQIASEDLKKGPAGQVGIEITFEYEDGSTETRFIDLF